MATLKTGLASSVDYDSATLGQPRLIAYVNGKNRAQITDGVSNWEMGVDAPPAVATFDSNIDGSLDESANYYVKHCYRRLVHGIIGNGSDASAVMTTGTALASEDGIRVDIPANASLQTGIDQVEVYRTLGGGTTYYYNGSKAYSGSAITYDITIADSAVGAQLQTTNNTPPTRPFIEAFGNQSHLWGSVTHSDGTIGVSNAGTTVTGASTSFTKGMVGMFFNRTGDGSDFYVITAVDVSAQTLTIAAYQGTTVASGASYTISQSTKILRSEWSHIDSSANIKPESFPTDNYDEFEGGGDNERATGIGKTNNQVILFTNRATWTQTKVGANTYRKELLMSGVGCINHRTIANNPHTGDIFWQNQAGQVMRSAGTAGSTFNLTEAFIANILDGTHDGIHRDLRVDTTKYADGHAIYYPNRGWYMLFQTLYGDTYPSACFIFNEKYNPTGAPGSPSPWMMWTGFNAVCSGMLVKSGILRPYFGDDLGFIWLMDDSDADGVPSGTSTGTITSISSTVLTDSAATFYTTGDGLKGVRVRTYNATTKALENDIVLASNNATTLTVAAWTTTPSEGDTYVVGGIVFERYTKVYHEGAPDKVKMAHNFYLSAKKTDSTRNLNIHHYKDMSATAELAAGQDIDLSEAPVHEIRVLANGNYHQIKMSNKFADQPIEVFDFSRDFEVRP